MAAVAPATATSEAHGFIDTHGTFTTIDYPTAGTTPNKGQGTHVFAENLLGVIVGTYVDNNNVWHGLIDLGGQSNYERTLQMAAQKND